MKKLFSNIGIRVSIITVIINLLLFIFKFGAGLIAHSQAMVSDAIHSLSDVITTIAVIIGLVFASKDADNKHPYGHERIESIVAIILAFILFLTGLYIGYIGLNTIFVKKEFVVPGILALVAALTSIVVKEGMYHYTMFVAKKINSASLKADAWHHRSDALSSVGSFIGIGGAILGLPILDPLCSLIICFLIIKSSLEIFADATNGILDTSCDEETTKKIVDTILSTKEDIIINELKTRMFGSKIYIDVEIAIDGSITLNNANKVVLKIHNLIEKKYDKVKHCNIHIVPREIN